jgi:predicted ATP-grasp superfamily ATP-dependent carboligase
MVRQTIGGMHASALISMNNNMIQGILLLTKKKKKKKRIG